MGPTHLPALTAAEKLSPGTHRAALLTSEADPQLLLTLSTSRPRLPVSVPPKLNVGLGGHEDGEASGALEHERVTLAHLGHLPRVYELDGAALRLVARPELKHIVSEGHLNTQPEREQRFHKMSNHYYCVFACHSIFVNIFLAIII